MNIELILGDFFNNFDKLESLSQEKTNDLSKVDIELSEFYHKMEGIHLSHNTQAHKYMLELQDILNRRRQLKLDNILMRSFIDNTKKSFEIAKERNKSALTKHNKVLREIVNKK
jgi:hypothetical protein